MFKVEKAMSAVESPVNFDEFLKDVAERSLAHVVAYDLSSSFMPAGHNGPYYDLETPVRNTAHWLITCCYLYVKSGDDKYKVVADRLANYLAYTTPHRRHGVYIHRQKPGKDWCNGVIGQAWVIEALAIASRTLSRDDLREAVVDSVVFPFSGRANAWCALDPHTKRLSVDYTLNHQLWYAVALTELFGDQCDQVLRFLDGLFKGGLRVRSSGIVNHVLCANTTKGVLVRARYELIRAVRHSQVNEKEAGYHLYNLHPLARLARSYSSHPLFGSAAIEKAVETLTQESFWNSLVQNKYSYGYNSPAFEYRLPFDIFIGGECLHERAIEERHVDITFDPAANLFSSGTADSVTLNARVYERWVGCF